MPETAAQHTNKQNQWWEPGKHVLAKEWGQDPQDQEGAQVQRWAVWPKHICFSTQFRVLNGLQDLQT